MAPSAFCSRLPKHLLVCGTWSKTGEDGRAKLRWCSGRLGCKACGRHEHGSGPRHRWNHARSASPRYPNAGARARVPTNAKHRPAPSRARTGHSWFLGDLAGLQGICSALDPDRLAASEEITGDVPLRTAETGSRAPPVPDLAPALLQHFMAPVASLQSMASRSSCIAGWWLLTTVMAWSAQHLSLRTLAVFSR